MKPYVVRSDAAAIKNVAQKSVVESSFDTLAQAIEAVEKSRNTAYVVHTVSGLHLRWIGDRFAWLDANGSEHPAP